MPKEDFKQGIENLKQMSEEDFREEYPTLSKTNTKLHVVCMLQTLLDEADPVNDEIALDWF